MPDADNLHKAVKFRRQRSEAVDKLRLHLVYTLVRNHRIEFLVDSYLLRRHAYVRVRNERHLVRLNGTVGYIRLINVARGESCLHSEFFHGFGKYLLIGFKAHISDETALFRSKKVAGPTDIEVLHRNIEPAAEVGERLYGLEAAACILCD